MNTDAFSVDGIQLSPGHPLPHASELRKILLSHVYDRKSDVSGASIIDFLLGNMTASNKTELDEGVLDVEKFRKIVQIAINKHRDEEQRNNGSLRRASHWFSTRLTYLGPSEKYNEEHIRIMDTTMDLMKQSIYNTRLTLKRIHPYRKAYSEDISYHIGVLYSEIMQKKDAMLRIHGVLLNYARNWVKFFHYLVAYERLLFLSVDLGYKVKRLFELHFMYTHADWVPSLSTTITKTTTTVTTTTGNFLGNWFGRR